MEQYSDAEKETKLNEKYKLEFKNYNILRNDINKEGGGLAFLIKNLYYEDIAVNIPNTSDLEAQGIKANWNLYQQNTNEDFRKAPTRIKDLEQNWISFKNTIIKAAKVSIPRDSWARWNPRQMISNFGKNGKERLLDIFNNSWKTGKLPQDWKTATIIPIKKLDKSPYDPKNYRPISLTSIEEKISHNSNIGLFVDDIILWSSNTNWKKAERDLNKTLLHLENFSNKHKLEFNPQKSETCLFTTDKKLYKIRPKIILKEQQLQYNKHPKYLGYTLDPEINSSKHIEEVIRKGRDRLKILKYISGREWGADATILKLTYTSLIRPILEYGYQIYGTASETNLKSLERIQLSAARS
ncbi:hypothetical protein LAZ67_11002330 [Cordylochernes scorpioides]|uniref:Reverse transcriptase domain-containing protein n=1 Tax=Cordylochernes scorpioides TaxID=51811 RepID=A0ABY6KZX1_9ARAC|nr:hypothetical protein LAZ67_11002330 [Cordylochernes scorpioides]